MITDIEATMEMVLPVLVTDVMQTLEDQGKHPEANFTEILRAALLKVVPEFPNIQDDVWDAQKKKPIVAAVCACIDL